MYFLFYQLLFVAALLLGVPASVLQGDEDGEEDMATQFEIISSGPKEGGDIVESLLELKPTSDSSAPGGGKGKPKNASGKDEITSTTHHDITTKTTTTTGGAKKSTGGAKKLPSVEEFLEESKYPDHERALNALWDVCETSQAWGPVFQSWRGAQWQLEAAKEAIASSKPYIQSQEKESRDVMLKKIVDARAKLSTLFKSMDLDHSDSLSPSELKSGLQKNTGNLKDTLSDYGHKDSGDQEQLFDNMPMDAVDKAGISEKYFSSSGVW